MKQHIFRTKLFHGKIGTEYLQTVQPYRDFPEDIFCMVLYSFNILVIYLIVFFVYILEYMVIFTPIYAIVICV